MALWLACLLLLGCGEFSVANPNEPNAEDLLDEPTRSRIASAVVGLALFSGEDAPLFLLQTGILGREALFLTNSDPRVVSEFLSGPLDASGFGADLWFPEYRNLLSAATLLEALDRTSGLTQPEKEAARGFVRTLEALNLLLVINAHDENGAVIETGLPLDQLALIETKEAVFARIVQLLDEGRDHLRAGGDEFPFELPSGFAGFDTPLTFLLFNRALAARVAVYRMRFSEALEALSESFLAGCGAFGEGVYFSYDATTGDLENGLATDPATSEIRAHPSLESLAERQPNGELDRRFLQKVFRTDPLTVQDHTSDLTFTIYQSRSSPIPIIRNEELILLRAEANIGLGDIPAAAEDINCVRVNVGGLAPRDDLSAANALDELLRQKLFSLLFEGGHHWIDLRRYGKLDELPLDLPTDIIQDRYPIPRSEELARGGG